MPATVVLMIDGLSAYMPGPYGNTTVDTPSMNRFAAEATLFDFCFTESPSLAQVYPVLWGALPDEGSVLVSDCEEVLMLSESVAFERVVDARGSDNSKLAESIAETQTASFFVNAIEALQTLEEGSLSWLHHSGLSGQWDAPWELRNSFADEEDPEPPRDVCRPTGTFNAKEDDPDILLGYQQSAYAQLVVIDQLLGVFLEQLKQNQLLDEIAIVFGSPRGYPLGEHGTVGSFDNLYSETIHVPLMIRAGADISSRLAPGSRHQGMVQFQQLNQMIAGLLDGGFHSVSFCDVAVSRYAALESIQNDCWKLIRNLEDPGKVELFTKPDDRWDVNNVSRRCANEVDEILNTVF